MHQWGYKGISKLSAQKIFYPKKICSEKNILSKNNLGQTIFGPKRFWSKKHFRPKTVFGPKKNFRAKIFFV